MTSADAWYAACLEEVSSALDKFEHQKQIVVKADSDLVAALVGILSAGPLIHAMGKHAEAALHAASLLERNPSGDR